MSRTENQQKTINLIESIRMCGKTAFENLNRNFRDCGIEDDLFFSRDYTDKHLEIAQAVWNLWHTTNNFKVGDKVYVVPLTHTLMKNCIRATITEADNNDGWGYRLRAFESDLPGIYMFNIWDKDLQPRIGKKNKPTPPELLIKN